MIATAILHRPIDSAALQAFSQAMASGVTRAQIAQIIVNSPEANNAAVQGLFQQFLGRSADSAVLSEDRRPGGAIVTRAAIGRRSPGATRQT